MATFAILTPVPQQVTNLVTQPANKSIALTWNAQFDQTETYEIWRSTTGDITTAAKLATSTTNGYTDSGLTTGTTYGYWVRAVNSFGTPGAFSSAIDYFYGATFNNLYLNVYDLCTSASTVSVQNIQANVYYTNFDGSTASTGLKSFLTVVTQSPDVGSVNWVNPDYARIDDTNYATASMVPTYSENLEFKLSDLGVPLNARVTGIAVQAKGQTSLYTGNTLRVFIGLPDVNVGTTQSFAAWTANNTDQTLNAGSSTNLFSAVPTLPYSANATPAQIDNSAITVASVVPAKLTNTTSSIVLNGFTDGYANAMTSTYNSYATTGVTVGNGPSSAGTATSITPAAREPGTAWSTWYDVASSGAVQFSPSPTVVFFNAFLDIDWANISAVTGTVTIQVECVLRNRTDSTDVATETFTLMSWNGATSTVLRSNPIIQFNSSFGSTGSPLPLNNKSFDVRWRMMKTRTDATATLNMYWNRSYIETSIG